ncbi:hypothetical protein TOL_3645 [Thalassolituus oleivorans MIL-1]|uniref:Uncharacterized protein n=1 Tax=Thalassolituus oleivorans MIL-1 TaxID=1298593 RepID=M5DX66_9GAMM|nr:hypothetical protein TOL_3645 [Thalassolituus oleivorans MIL-1]
MIKTFPHATPFTAKPWRLTTIRSKKILASLLSNECFIASSYWLPTTGTDESIANRRYAQR